MVGASPEENQTALLDGENPLARDKAAAVGMHIHKKIALGGVPSLIMGILPDFVAHHADVHNYHILVLHFTTFSPESNSSKKQGKNRLFFGALLVIKLTCIGVDGQ